MSPTRSKKPKGKGHGKGSKTPSKLVKSQKSTKLAKPRGSRAPAKPARALSVKERAFAEVVGMIQAARGKAAVAVNTALVDLYWQVGEYIARKLETAAWGEGVVEALAQYIQRRHQNLRGFTRRNLFRMRQFYQTYRGDKKVAPLVRQLPWTHHLIILGQSKRPEEREFYLRLAVRERWSKRELERQLRTAAFERAVLHPARVSPLVAQMHSDARGIFKDSYVVEFLDLPSEHSESDLHRGLVDRLQATPHAPIEWQTHKLSGQDTLAARVSKRGGSDPEPPTNVT